MSVNMTALEQGPTAYEILGVHPSAPSDLISACYWAMTSDLQKRRATEPEADAVLHRLTHAYESVSDPVRRAGYNLSIGYADEPLSKRALPRRRSFLLRVFRRNRHALEWSVGPHEVLGLRPNAPEASVSVAYRIMRDTYRRLAPGSRRRETLLNLLDESYVVLGDPQQRAQLARVGPAEEHEPPPSARDDPPVRDLREPSAPEVTEAKVALPIVVPAPAESPRRPETPLSVPGGPVAEAPTPVAPPEPQTTPPRVLGGPVAEAPGPVELPKLQTPLRRVLGGPTAARAGREDGAGVRQTAVATVVAFAAAVARGLLWVVVAVVVLTVAAVHSGWEATRKWLRQSGDERQETAAARSREASSPLPTPDEVFLGRLASTVGRSETERRRSSDETTRR